MAYTSLDQLKSRYGEGFLISLTDRGEVATGAIDTDAVDQAIVDADAMIDGYLKGRYVLPLADVPALVSSLSRAISLYNLHIYDAPEKITADYEKALRQLKEIAQGVITLDVAGVEPDTSDTQGVLTTDRDRPMTAQSLKGFI